MKRISQGLLLIFLILLVGCAKPAQEQKPVANSTPKATTEGSATPQSKQNADQSAANQKKITVNLYFPDDQAMYLTKVPKEVVVTDGAIVKAIIAALQAGEPGYGKVIPPEAKLLKATVKDGIVNLDFSKEFKDKHWGGSTGETFTIYGIVNSLTELPNIKAVQFYLEGQVQTEMMGHYDWSKPFTRDTSLIKSN